MYYYYICENIMNKYLKYLKSLKWELTKCGYSYKLTCNRSKEVLLNMDILC